VQQFFSQAFDLRASPSTFPAFRIIRIITQSQTFCFGLLVHTCTARIKSKGIEGATRFIGVVERFLPKGTFRKVCRDLGRFRNGTGTGIHVAPKLPTPGGSILFATSTTGAIIPFSAVASHILGVLYHLSFHLYLNSALEMLNANALALFIAILILIKAIAERRSFH